MNYSEIYNQLISNRKRNALSAKLTAERHHIVPVALGGGNEKGNLVRLTPREHFIAHRLLAKIHGGPMWSAIVLMSGIKRYGAIRNGSLYEKARREHTKTVSNLTKRRWADPDERRSLCEKLSDGVKAAYENTPGLRKKSSDAAKKRWKSDEYRKKFSEARSGLYPTDKARENLSNGQIKRFRRPSEVQANRDRLREYYKDNDAASDRMSKQAKDMWRDPETRKRMTDERKKRWECPEYRKKMTAIARERAKDPEFLRKQSEAKKGKHVSEETRRKLSKANTGRIVSDETRKKISDAAKKIPRTPASEETKKRMSEAQKKRWAQRRSINA